MSFCLNRKSRIIIFGKSIRAKYLADNLRKNQFYNIHICGGDLDKICEEIEADESTIWFLAFQNAGRHKEFASRLSDRGFSNIIFLPTVEAVNWEQGIRIRQIYNYFLYGELEEGLQIPVYDEIVGKPINTVNAIINEECGLTTFWARIETVFVNEQYEKFRKLKCRANLVHVGHYRSMFEKVAGLDTEELSWQEYCDEQGITEENQKEKIFDRYSLYALFERNINREGRFFSASASIAEWNSNGGFYIKEGLHRAVFLMMQGWAYIPVTILTKDFRKIYPEEKVLRLGKFFEDNHIEKTVTPISHPAFYDFPAEKEMLEPSVLTAVRRFWGIEGFGGKRILDMSDYNSYFARNVGRVLWNCNSAIIESRETDELKYQLAVLYNDLLNIRNVEIKYEPSLKICSNYDIVFLLGKIKFNSENLDFLMCLEQYVQDAVVFECDLEECEGQINLFTENTSFKENIYLHQYFNGTKIRVILVFRKK